MREYKCYSRDVSPEWNLDYIIKAKDDREFERFIPTVTSDLSRSFRIEAQGGEGFIWAEYDALKDK